MDLFWGYAKEALDSSGSQDENVSILKVVKDMAADDAKENAVSALNGTGSVHIPVNGNVDGVPTGAYIKMKAGFSELSPNEGKQEVSDVQKYLSIGESSYDETTKDSMIKKMMTSSDGEVDSGYAKYQTARNAGMSTKDYFTVKNATSGITKGYHKGNDSLENSESLIKLEAIYNSGVSLTTAQWKVIYEDLGIGKKVRGWSPALVRQKLAYYRSIADDYKQ